MGQIMPKHDSSAALKPRRILLLSTPPRGNAKTIYDHLRSFGTYSSHHISSISTLATLQRAIHDKVFLRNFDALVLHYSIYTPTYLGEEDKRAIGDFPGLKVMFIQDEHRNINAVRDGIRLMKIDVLFTCMPDSEIEKIYPVDLLQNLRKINNLTGYVPPDLLKTARLATYQARSNDVGYRSRKIPLWMGSLGKDKWEIVPKFLEAASPYGLCTDLSYKEEDRIYGNRWIRFLKSCRAVLGVESGASVFDFTGEIQRAAEAYEREHPDASYEEIRDLFFPGLDGLIRHNQISPRCFEAAALKTLMIQYPGDYSGILKPWRHYVPLCKDMSNIAEVIDTLRDQNRTQDITECAFEEVARSPAWSYETFIHQFDQVVDSEILERSTRSADDVSLTHSMPGAKMWICREHLLPVKYQLLTISRKLHPMAYLIALWQKLPPWMKGSLRPVIRHLFRRKE